jgi:hypothetical protein
MEASSSQVSAVRQRARELVERVDDVNEAFIALRREYGVSEDAARHLVLSAQVRMFQDLAGISS